MSVGRKPRKPLPRYTRLVSGKPVKRKARTKSERTRIYGTDAHQDWLRGLPCAGCLRMGTAEYPHHLHHVKNGGMGRKANAEQQVPLCYACHQELHNHGPETFELAHAVTLHGDSLVEWAAHYARQWQHWKKQPKHIAAIVEDVMRDIMERAE